VAHADDGFGYETMFLVQPHPGQALDVDAIRLHLGRIGESVLVAGDPRAAKVHVHSERPDEVLAYGLSIGSLSRINVENLDGQARDVRERRAADFTASEPGGVATAAARRSGVGPGGEAGPVPAGAVGTAPTGIAIVAWPGSPSAGVATAAPPASPAAGIAPAPAPSLAAPRAPAADDAFAPLEVATGPAAHAIAEPVSIPLAVVAVAAGDGLASVFESFGVAAVVRGGQSANPSTGELLAAVDALAADEVLLLPNNPNVILAARQVADMARIPVRVVPTRNAAEGVAALLALDPALDATENAGPMLEAARGLQTLQVTEAVRDARIAGRKVKRGQTIVLDPDDGLVASGNDRDRALLAGLRTLRPGFELITLYYGEGADLEEAERLSRLIAEWRPDVEVELVHGGQAYYRYLVAAE